MKSVAQLHMLLRGTLHSRGRGMKRSQGSQNYCGQTKVPWEARPPPQQHGSYLGATVAMPT
jgi:hypothetical protein